MKTMNRVLVVDCGASHVACGRFSGGPKELVLEHSASVTLPASDLNEDAWIVAVGAALRELARTGQLRGGCLLGLPGHLTISRPLHLPRAATAQRRKIIEFEQRQGISAASEPMIWSRASVTEVNDGQQVILAAAKKRVIAELVAQAIRAGLQPTAVLPSWMVLRHAAESCPPTPDGALVLSVGARSSQLVFCSRDRFFVRTIAIGGNLVTQKLAEELGLDFPSAEALKLRGFEAGGGSGDAPREHRAGQMALDQFGRRLCAEIQHSPPLDLPAGDPARPATLFLTGAGARLQQLPGALAERLQLKVERWDFRARTDSSPAISTIDGVPGDGLLVNLTGLAAGAAKGMAEEGNLLSPSLRRELFLQKHWRWLAAAALVGIVAGLGPAWWWWAKARAVRLEVAEMDAAISALRQIDAGNRSTLARLAGVRHRTLALQSLATARSGWDSLLGELQRRLDQVEDAWIDRLQLLPGGAADAPENLRIQLAGKLLDAGKLSSGAGGGSDQKAKTLVAALRGSAFVGAVEREHFADGPPGLSCFEITLRLTPHALN